MYLFNNTPWLIISETVKITQWRVMFASKTDTVLNKSDYSLNEHHKKELMYGLNFAPTPNWTKEVEFNERLNLAMHVCRVEWEDILTREENYFENEIP